MNKYALLAGLVICLKVIGSTYLHSQDPAMLDLVGFAGVNGVTTGGAGGDSITVTTGTELQNALKNKQDSEIPLVILVKGAINLANSPELSKIDVKDVSDVTIIGDNPYAEFDGIGIKIRRASNIIIRNLKIHHVLSGEKDCMGIEGPANHIWIDHCELYNEFQGVDKDYYDGLLDAKADAEYLTYSWNFLHDSWKTALVGSSESDIYNRKLTMHHNYFLNCNSRLPLFRASTGHFFNNYYKDIASTAINTRINSCVRIESNYFENTKNPWVSAYSDVLGGGEAIDNILVNSPFVYSDNTHEILSCSPEIPYEYASVLHDASDVPGVVMAFAGVGKLDNGVTSPLSSDEMPIHFYPNPVQATAYIEFTAKNTGITVISIKDMTGRKIHVFEEYVTENSKQHISFDAGSYSPGLYLLEIRSGSMATLRQFIILDH